jgi:hypothetical protein
MRIDGEFSTRINQKRNQQSSYFKMVHIAKTIVAVDPCAASHRSSDPAPGLPYGRALCEKLCREPAGASYGLDDQRLGRGIY